MKVIAVLLSILMLSMSVIPTEHGLPLVHQKDNNAMLQHHKSHHDSDDYICDFQCYSITVSIPEILVFDFQEIQTLVFIKALFSYKSEYNYTYIETVWHPPSSC